MWPTFHLHIKQQHNYYNFDKHSVQLLKLSTNDPEQFIFKNRQNIEHIL